MLKVLVITGLLSLLASAALLAAAQSKRSESPWLPRLAKAALVVAVVSVLLSWAVVFTLDESRTSDTLHDNIEKRYGITIEDTTTDRRDLYSWTIDGRDYLCRVTGPEDREARAADPTLECVTADEVVEFAR